MAPQRSPAPVSQANTQYHVGACPALLSHGYRGSVANACNRHKSGSMHECDVAAQCLAESGGPVRGEIRSHNQHRERTSAPATAANIVAFKSVLRAMRTKVLKCSHGFIRRGTEPTVREHGACWSPHGTGDDPLRSTPR